MAGKTVKVRIKTAHPQGGVNYVPPGSAPGTEPTTLWHGEVHEVDQAFARVLEHQDRAVILDRDALEPEGPLTTESLSNDPEPITAPDARASRRR